MEAVNSAVSALKQMEPRAIAISLALAAILALSVSIMWSESSDRPPMLSDTIPYVSNTYQYMANMNKFLSRATYDPLLVPR